MRQQSALAAVRYGNGLSPRIPAPSSPNDLLDRLVDADRMAFVHPMPTFADQADHALKISQALVARKESNGPAEKKALQDLYRQTHVRTNHAMALTMARALDAGDGFRERLVRFWGDHFTIVARRAQVRGAGAIFVEEAVRPHVTGRFADMLKAAILHPYMLIYLDQTRSVGPNSPAAQRRKQARNPLGLNENLARELLELHTLGVSGTYTQADVRQVAELLAGLTARAIDGVAFRPNRGEPGPETILGQTYGGTRPDLGAIEALLDDLAVHPDTARHLAQKLVVHFVSDAPDPDHVAYVADRYRATGGDLFATYEALLEHPAAWALHRDKVKQPYDFIVTSLRALGVRGRDLVALSHKRKQRLLRMPMTRMGQRWEIPSGPDGWPEDAAHWISPVGMAARITWAMRLGHEDGLDLPDPRAFVTTALGPLAQQRTKFAAEAAETRKDGVGVVLASPDFQRR